MQPGLKPEHGSDYLRIWKGETDVCSGPYPQTTYGNTDGTSQREQQCDYQSVGSPLVPPLGWPDPPFSSSAHDSESFCGSEVSTICFETQLALSIDPASIISLTSLLSMTSFRLFSSLSSFQFLQACPTCLTWSMCTAHMPCMHGCIPMCQCTHLAACAAMRSRPKIRLNVRPRISTRRTTLEKMVVGSA